MPLYIDEDTGRQISTHSMLKTFRRCPKQADYKYAQRLKPKVLGTPLRRGKWLHYLLEEHHAGRDWREMHRKLCTQFSELLDEEKDYYGDLPNDCYRIMESYEWYYKSEPWKVVETEFTVETEFPDGTIYRGKVDALVESPHGLFVVDHKSHKTLPGHTFRLLDAQSALYLWACLRNRIPVEGFIWNYLRYHPPSIPQMAYLGKKQQRLSKREIDTDYLTFVRTIKQYKEEHGLRITPEIIATANRLKADRYVWGQPQFSANFRRVVLEKHNDLLRRVATENYHTSKRMHSYDFTNTDAVERVVDRSCDFMCSYTDLCTVELLGGNPRFLRSQNYTIGDPQDYYHDRAGEDPRKEVQ